MLLVFPLLFCSVGALDIFSRVKRPFSLKMASSAVKKEENSSSPTPPWLPSFLTAASGGLLFGSDIGSSSSVVRILGTGQSELGTLDPIQLGQIASVSLFGAILASGALIGLGDKKIGRKSELIFSSLCYLAGTLVEGSSTAFGAIIAGRVLYGVGIGTAMHVAPLYIAETAPDNLRGKLVSLKEAVIVGGIVLGYGAGAVFGKTSDWHSVFYASLPFEFAMLFGALTVSESPRWLALRGRPDEAVTALQKVQGLDEVEARATVDKMVQATIATAAADENERQDKDGMIERLGEIFSSPVNRRAMIIGVGLVVLQQLSGQPSVLYFANRIFEDAGLGYEAAVGVGLFKLVMTIISASLVENPKYGRRKLLLYGNAGVTVSLATLAGLYATAGAAGPSSSLVIACILAFVGFYQIGFGPLTWLILSEIFPLRVRGAAVSLGTLANFGCNLIVALLFEAERTSMGEGALFGQFALVAAVATWFTYYFVFETQGLSLEAIEAKLTRLVDGDASAADVE